MEQYADWRLGRIALEGTKNVIPFRKGKDATDCACLFVCHID